MALWSVQQLFLLLCCGSIVKPSLFSTLWQAWKSLSNASGVSRSYLRPGVSAPIIDKEKLNSLSFRQGTPCQSNNGNIVHGSKDAAHRAGFIPETKDVGHRLSDESTSLRASTSYVGGQATPLEHKRTQTFSGPPPTSADVANFVGQPIMGIPLDLRNQTSMSSDTASSHRNMKGIERSGSLAASSNFFIISQCDLLCLITISALEEIREMNFPV